MTRKRLLCCYLLLFFHYNANSQEPTIDTYTNQLFFNVFREKPDSNIAGFLKFHVPSLMEKNTVQVPWRVYRGDTSKTFQEIHSFVFTRHPFFREKFSQGRLEITCKRYGDTALLQNILTVQLWFEFETQEQAELAFSRLVDMFILFATDKKFSSTNGSQKAAFLNRKENRGFNRVQFRLSGDNISRYRYKILFETGNDL